MCPSTMQTPTPHSLNPDPERIIVGTSEIAKALGVSRQRVSNWKSRDSSFPKPVAELRMGPVWYLGAILVWRRDHPAKRRPSTQLFGRRRISAR